MIIAISFIFPLVLKIIIVRMSQQTDCCLETWKQWTACFSSSPTTRDTTLLLLKRWHPSLSYQSLSLSVSGGADGKLV